MDFGRVANKIGDILSDNRILPAEWKWYIPMMIVQQPRPIVVNARNLADGILEAIEKYDIYIPEFTIPSFEGSNEYQLELDWEQ